MLLRQVLELFDLLDTPNANGTTITELLKERGAAEVSVENVKGEEGDTDCVTILIKGSEGKSSGGTAPTLGIIGRLGGLGARPEVTGFIRRSEIGRNEQKRRCIKGRCAYCNPYLPGCTDSGAFPCTFYGLPNRYDNK